MWYVNPMGNHYNLFYHFNLTIWVSTFPLIYTKPNLVGEIHEHKKKLRNLNMTASNKLRLYLFKLNKVGGNFLTFGKEKWDLR